MNNHSDFNPDNSTIDFDQCLKYLEMVGQKHLNPKFKIIPEDHQLIFKLLVYFYKDLPNVERYGLDLKKGILLSGPIGCGKTSLFQLLRFYLQREAQYIVKPAREIVLEFLDEGHKVINKYSFGCHHFINGEVHHKILCIDDLGIESTIKYYGNETNVIGEIILSRHRLYTDHGAITHATTNLSAQELENIYGNRVRSRMREMFNLMAYTATSKDKRK